MYRYISHITIISCLLFCTSCDDNDKPPDSDTGPYNVGDIISGDDLEMKFGFCYPSCTNNPDNCDDLTTDEADTTFSFADHAGKVFMIEMSATWWGPCFSAIPEGDDIYKHWANNDSVKIIHFLDDIGEPYTCPQWGHQGDLFIPPIVDDGPLYTVRDWFPINSASESQYPITIFIDHNMQIISIQFVSLAKDDANYFIEQMLNAM